MAESEATIEVFFHRKYNLGNFNDKTVELKLSGTQSQVDKQLNEEKQKLINYIAQLENVFDVANDANILKQRLEKTEKEKQALQEL